MKVALLVPGFVRNITYLKSIKAFLENNPNHKIDIYSHSYNVLGSGEYKTILYKKPKILEDLKKAPIALDFAKDYFEFKKLELEDIDDRLDNIKNYLSPKIYETFRGKHYCNKFLPQWKDVYLTYKLISKPSSYDCIIRSRYDNDMSKILLDSIEAEFSKDTLYRPYNPNVRMPLNDGTDLGLYPGKVHYALGSPKVMKIYCELGSPKVLERLFWDERFESDWYYETHCKDLKTNHHYLLIYYLDILCKVKSQEIHGENFVPNTRRLDRLDLIDRQKNIRRYGETEEQEQRLQQRKDKRTRREARLASNTT